MLSVESNKNPDVLDLASSPLSGSRARGAEGRQKGENMRKSVLPVWCGVTLLMTALVLPGVAQAQFNYTTNKDGTITIVGYAGPGGAVTIPADVNGMPVTAVGQDAFLDCTNLASIVIPDSVTSIGYMAFDGCPSLTNATIGKEVASIGDFAFSVIASLLAITVDAANMSYSSLDGVLFNKGQTTLIQYPGGRAGSYTVPSSVTSIGEEAFSGTSLTGVTIGDSVTSIGDYAFSGTSLTNVTIADSVATIGTGAFSWCSRLTSMAIPNSVTNIGNFAFQNCLSLAGVTIPEGITAIGDYTFSSCGLTNIAIPGSVASVGDNAFSGCRLRSLTISEGVTSIGEYAFAGCGGLTSVTIPSTVTSIGDHAFSGCYFLASLTIAEGVTSIGEYAFSGCHGLTSVTIPSTVTSIGSYAFSSCGSLTSVYFQGDAPRGDWTVFSVDGLAMDEWVPTLYYLPGTTGLGSTFGILPTVLWDPRPQTGGAGFGVRTNRFGFTITGTPGIVVVVEASSDLSEPAWFPVRTNTLTGGSSYFSDPQWTNYPGRFYRLRSP